MTDIVESDDDFENAVTGFKRTQDTMREHHGNFRSRKGKRARGGGGKGMFGGFVTALGRVEDVLDDGLGKLDDHVGGFHKKLKTHHENTRRTDDDSSTRLNSLNEDHDTGRGPGQSGAGPGGPGDPGGSGGPGGPGGQTPPGERGPDRSATPVYYVGDNGEVRQLVNGKFVPVSATDGSGIHTMLDSQRRRANDPDEETRKNLHARADGDPAVVSSKPITEPTPLSTAVEDVREAIKNKKGKSEYGGRNYAALRHRDADGNEFVLVGRSSGKRSHSERSIGHPIINSGMVGGVRELYSEREPCQADSTCDRWLERHFHRQNPNIDYSHGVTYDNSVSNEDGRDGPHQEYRRQLQDDHANGDRSGTMGRHDFEGRAEHRRKGHK